MFRTELMQKHSNTRFCCHLEVDARTLTFFFYLYFDIFYTPFRSMEVPVQHLIIHCIMVPPLQQ